MKQRWAALAWVLDFDDTFIESICSKENIDRYLAVIFAAKFLLQVWISCTSLTCFLLIKFHQIIVSLTA